MHQNVSLLLLKSARTVTGSFFKQISIWLEINRCYFYNYYEVYPPPSFLSLETIFQLLFLRYQISRCFML
ncbi:hypothetical protein BHG07_04690 [Brenneria salicis ATCC 15712 = DSM 30166]|nr:hypothetical protein BHG07_04690 [Brenneria salicis ATCC 15712 = DSM 30166]